MNFHLDMWNRYRRQAGILGEHIQSFKDNKGIIHMEKEQLAGYIAHITCILKECDDYMNKCGLTMPPALWKYNAKDPTTHPSSKLFLYKDCMTEFEIKAYGSEFMMN